VLTWPAAAAAGASAISLSGRIAAHRTTSNDSGSFPLGGGKGSSGGGAVPAGKPKGLGLAGRRLQQQQQQLSLLGGAAVAAGVPGGAKSRFEVLERVRLVDLAPRSISADARF
jgi:hypothetical protein